MPTRPQSEVLAPRIRGYRLGVPFGAGSTGVVLRGVRVIDGKQAAIKTLKPEHVTNLDLCERLLREAEVARAVRHPGIVTVLDDGLTHDGAPYVSFELLHGESLLSLVRRAGPLPVSHAALVGRMLAYVLSAVHLAGYVHRDVKPEHVLLSGRSGGLCLKLIDFGICQAPGHDLLDGAVRERRGVLGTPGYLSPEQAMGELPVDPRSDLYGLGATLFEALTGTPPFVAANAAALMTRTLQDDAPKLHTRRPDAPPALSQLMARLLEKRPEERPDNAHTVARALTGFVGDERAVESSLGELLARPATEARAEDSVPTRRSDVPRDAFA